MKLDFDNSQGTIHATSRTTTVNYPNGSFTVSSGGLYSLLVCVVNSTGKDMVRLKHNGQEYCVWMITTHDGLEIEYNEKGDVISWDHLIGDEDE
jgi:hypothetical protein